MCKVNPNGSATCDNGKSCGIDVKTLSVITALTYCITDVRVHLFTLINLLVDKGVIDAEEYHAMQKRFEVKEGMPVMDLVKKALDEAGVGTLETTKPSPTVSTQNGLPSETQNKKPMNAARGKNYGKTDTTIQRNGHGDASGN